MDLTSIFLAAKEKAHEWDEAAFHRALKLVSDNCPKIRVDSSDVDDSGKNWARLYGAIKNNEPEHFGIMWSEGPLCFLSPYIVECAGPELIRNGVTVITVSDFDAPYYSIDPSLSEDLFEVEWEVEHIDPNSMSILDLEWMTI
ncbi:MAG: hypothetical protein GX139_00675 [Armatimonadetes bacterium]|jgi:hypothetical protein|nr:hypothetical protein [Armatimonadota bacterium]